MPADIIAALRQIGFLPFARADNIDAAEDYGAWFFADRQIFASARRDPPQRRHATRHASERCCPRFLSPRAARRLRIITPPF